MLTVLKLCTQKLPPSPDLNKLLRRDGIVLSVGNAKQELLVGIVTDIDSVPGVGDRLSQELMVSSWIPMATAQ